MSTLKADTIVASDGSSPVTLTKQSAAKAYAYLADGGTESNTLNISSLTDDSSGRMTVTLSNGMSVSSDIVAFGTVQRTVSSTADMAVVVVRKTDMTSTVIKVAIGHTSDHTKDFDCSFLVHGDLA